jgi:hypothetical protein
MNNLAIFFVPVGATQRDFEHALREYFTRSPVEKIAASALAEQAAVATDNDQLPLWTWFAAETRRNA